MTYEFKLPDIGEGLTEGEVVKWHVKEGDPIRENQPMVSVLTDKAEVEIPSPKTGRVSKLVAKEGQRVKVGGVLIAFDVEGGGPAHAAPPAGRAAGNGGAGPAAPPAADSPAKPSGGVNAMPAVRKLAADLRVDITAVAGTGPGGRITEEDVRAAAGSPPRTAARPSAAEESIPFIGVRRRTAEKMAESSRVVAHVTHADEADFTALVAVKDELAGEAGKRGVKLTFLPFIIKALAQSLKEHPDLNAVLDEERGVIIRKKQYNIGIAANTEHGLMVPVVRDADAKDVWALAAEVNRLAEKARANKVDPSDLQGGTFTITNIGPIGGLFATPIVNHPEVAILAVMKLQKRPVARDGAVVIRDMVNLALSFDHRVLDGAEAAHFTNALIRRLENPRTLL